MNVNERDRRRPAPLFIGCAGWSLASKDAPSFPGEGSHLERYSRVLPCVEINSSFYRSHQEKTYVRWAASVPVGFRFSVKMPRTITHEMRLRHCDAPLEAFLGEIAGLGEKLGCILIQLPPSLALDVRTARSFFAVLRKRTRVPVVCEPRHASWFTPEGVAVLTEGGVSCVWAHPSPVSGIEAPDDASWLYIRLHGAPQIYYSAYDDAFIQGIAMRMRLAREAGRIAWCIFDNTARGEAVPNALTLVHRLSD
jgi:uncharacterized protein YecE (DUF72 family)